MHVPDIKRGSDSRGNWPTINAGLGELRQVCAEQNRLRDAVENLRRGDRRRPADNFPFRLYTIPNSQRILEDPEWWRKFTVQHGFVNNAKTATTDDADGEWGTDQTMEIEAPLNTKWYYVWVESSLSGGNVTANTIQTGDKGWPGFPGQTTESGKAETLIARIDTQTRLAEKVAIVRQFVFQDITLGGTGNGGQARWS